jgi:hypothetical protein
VRQETEAEAVAPKGIWADRAIILIGVCAFIGLAVRIFQLGFLPPDDALRYAARGVSGKRWAEVIVIRPEITIDHNPGWNLLQRGIYKVTHGEPRELVAFSMVAAFSIFAIVPLFWLRRPEAWIGALTLMMVVFPYFAERLMVGRPFLLTAAVALLLLCWWREDSGAGAIWTKLFASTVLMALCVWIHGSWYLLGMLPGVFFASRRWRAGFYLVLCWVGGAVMGAIFTGQPWKYLYESVLILFLALGQKVPLNALAGEFQPFQGGYPALAIVAVVLFARVKSGLSLGGVSKDPALWLAGLGWVLGFKVFRFWLDWGLPALALWTAMQLQELLEANVALWRTNVRCGIGAATAALLVILVANDKDERWSRFSRFEAMDAKRAEHAEWVPERGGILYAVNMSVFYETFFTNPRGDWRYILGFEPSFMMPEDYAVFRELWETLNAMKAVQPWVVKMRMADRLVLLGPETTRPALPELEWKYIVKDTWVGRLRRESSRPVE